MAHGAQTHVEDGDERTAAAYDAALIRRLWSFVRPHQRWIWSSFVLALLASGSMLARPWLVMRAIDEHLAPVEGTAPGTSPSLDGFWVLLALFAFVSIVELLARAVQTWTLDVAGQNALVDLRLAVFRHLQRLSSAFYDRTPIGRLVGRVTTDVEALQELFSSGVVTVLTDFVFLAATVVILFSLSWQLALVTMLVVPVLLALTLFVRVRVRKAYVDMIARRSKMNAFIHEHVAGMPLIQAFVRERSARSEFGDVNAGLRDSQLVAVRWESWLSALTEMLGSFTIALILWYGAGLSEGGVVSLGVLYAFIDYMRSFFAPLNDLSLKYTVMQNAMTASERIFALMDVDDVTPEDRATGAPDAQGEPSGALAFRDVTFSYDGVQDVLSNLSFEVEPGERVAIVGATGSGKTTILKLLTRLYDVGSGSIELDGMDVRRYALDDLRRRVGIVPQDVFLFGGDVLGNVRLGHPEITEADAIAAADRLHLDEVVARFPLGYREPVRERGKNLSSGERQLVAFARVLAVAPPVLALDEATSNVDSHTEHLLQEAVHEIVQGRTSLVIAHRLSTIRDVDRILVLHKGELVEEGTHDELHAQRGTYWRLYQLQYGEGSEAPSA